MCHLPGWIWGWWQAEGTPLCSRWGPHLLCPHPHSTSRHQGLHFIPLGSLPQPLCGPLAHSDPEDLPHLQAACSSGSWGRGAGRRNPGARGRWGRGAKGPPCLWADPTSGLQPHASHLLWLPSPCPPCLSWVFNRPLTLYLLFSCRLGLKHPPPPPTDLFAQPPFLPSLPLIFLYVCHTHDMWKFPGQRLDLSHSSDNTRSLTH